MKKLLNDFINNEDGVTAIEYSLIGVAMAVVVGTAMTAMKTELTEIFNSIMDALREARR